ncbi:thymidine phosphorylase, partial [Mycobacterium tuberculosis]|nr:thymidine phosphorylase [Mycobacterium tuberculosis]
DLTCALAREALAAVGVDDDPRERLRDGRAMDSFRAMITAQGGDPDAALPVAAHTEELRAPDSGEVRWDALGVGRASWLAGAGRTRPGET